MRDFIIVQENICIFFIVDNKDAIDNWAFIMPIYRWKIGQLKYQFIPEK